MHGINEHGFKHPANHCVIKLRCLTTVRYQWQGTLRHVSGLQPGETASLGNQWPSDDNRVFVLTLSDNVTVKEMKNILLMLAMSLIWRTFPHLRDKIPVRLTWRSPRQLTSAHLLVDPPILAEVQCDVTRMSSVSRDASLGLSIRKEATGFSTLGMKSFHYWKRPKHVLDSRCCPSRWRRWNVSQIFTSGVQRDNIITCKAPYHSYRYEAKKGHGC